MSEVVTPQVPLDVLGKEIIACVERVFRDQKKSDEWRATAKQKLIEAFKRSGGGAAFKAFLEPVWNQIEVVQDDSGVATPLSLSYAYEIMAKSPEESRADWRDQAIRKRDAANAAKAAAKAAKDAADNGADSRSPGKIDKPLRSPRKTPSLPHKAKTQPQLLAAFRKCVDPMTSETRREALAYLNGRNR